MEGVPVVVAVVVSQGRRWCQARAIRIVGHLALLQVQHVLRFAYSRPLSFAKMVSSKGDRLITIGKRRPLADRGIPVPCWWSQQHVDVGRNGWMSTQSQPAQLGAPALNAAGEVCGVVAYWDYHTQRHVVVGVDQIQALLAASDEVPDPARR